MTLARGTGARRRSRALLALVVIAVALVFAILSPRRRAPVSPARAQAPSALAQPPALAQASAPAQLPSALAQPPGPSQPPALAQSAGSANVVSKRPPNAAPAAAQKVTVGIYLHHLMQVDMRANAFLADLYVWFRWRGEIDPTLSFELRNAVEQWQIVKVPAFMDASGAPAPVTLEDGSKYQVFRIEARFGQPFSVQSYPLDEHDLPIEVEESRYLTKELVYELDPAGSRIDRRIVIPGWEVSGATASVDEAEFDTTFGDPRASGGERYARAKLNVHIVRPTRGMIVKTVVPLAIVILITFGVFFVAPILIDARLTLSVTALVSAVALEFSTSTELPEVGYLVLLDKVYILSYVVILGTVAASIFAARLAEREELARAKRLDKGSGIALSVLFFGGTLLILLVR